MKKYAFNKAIPIIFEPASGRFLNYLLPDFKFWILNHRKNQIVAAVMLVILMETACVALNIAGLYLLLTTGYTTFVIWSLLAFFMTLIVLITGKRIAQDFSWAMNISVYFILTYMVYLYWKSSKKSWIDLI